MELDLTQLGHRAALCLKANIAGDTLQLWPAPGKTGQLVNSLSTVLPLLQAHGLNAAAVWVGEKFITYPIERINPTNRLAA